MDKIFNIRPDLRLFCPPKFCPKGIPSELLFSQYVITEDEGCYDSKYKELVDPSAVHACVVRVCALLPPGCSGSDTGVVACYIN